MPPIETLDEYVDHLVAGHDDVILAEAQALATDLPGLHRLYVDVVQPAQYRVGELWEGGKISVATEHLATAIHTFVTSTVYARLAGLTVGGPRAIVACAPGELHELGARMFADLLECDGWDVDYFGASMPQRDLVAAVMERRPRVVGLSAALLASAGSVQRTIQALRAAMGEETPPVIVGGNAFQGNDELWRKVGADLRATDASQAIELLRALRDG
jgi:MerR family transcriptional regulator, light-induced transcriptional regulator